MSSHQNTPSIDSSNNIASSSVSQKVNHVRVKSANEKPVEEKSWGELVMFLEQDLEAEEFIKRIKNMAKTECNQLLSKFETQVN